MTYLQPFLLVMLVLAAIGLWRIPRRGGRALAIAGVAGIFLWSWPPAEWLLSLPLTARYAVRPLGPDSHPQAIVVFAESVQPPLFGDGYPLAGENTYRRCEYAAWIYRRIGPLPVLVSGGRGSQRFPPVAVTMRDVLLRDGLPPDMVWTEEESHSTHENAVYSARILARHGISRVALVVDATSMARAEACMRKEQVQVIPAPCAFHVLDPWQDQVLPSARSIHRNDDNLHEILGIVWYRLRGWI